MSEASEQDQHQMDIVVGGMMRQIKKTYKEVFQPVFDGLLEDISVDFDIPLEELTKKYEIKYKFHPRKPRDPAMACKDFTKNGYPCARSKRPGHDYCGIHLRTRGIDPNSVSATTESVNNEEAQPAEPSQPYVSKARRLKELKKEQKGEKHHKSKEDSDQDQDQDQDQEESETETESSTNGSEGETNIEVMTIDDKQYVVVNGNKLFNHPGKDEIESINELGQMVGLRLHGGAIEWI